MKCTINEDGLLIIDGVNKRCPYAEGATGCGTWCPLFSIDKTTDTNHVYVELCKKTWDFWVEDYNETILP